MESIHAKGMSEGKKYWERTKSPRGTVKRAYSGRFIKKSLCMSARVV